MGEVEGCPEGVVGCEVGCEVGQPPPVMTKVQGRVCMRRVVHGQMVREQKRGRVT